MAQLKDLIVNGPTRLIGPAYGLISSASTVPVTNCASTLSYGTTKTIANIGGYDVTVTLPNGGYQGDQGDQGDQGANGRTIYCAAELEVTGKAPAVWTGTTGSNSGVGTSIHFSNVHAASSFPNYPLVVGDYIGFWGQDTEGNGHLNIAQLTAITTTNQVDQNVSGTVVSSIIAPKGAQGAQGDQGANGSSAEGSSLSVKGAASSSRCYLLGTNSTDSTGTPVTLTSGNTFRAMGSTTGTGVYYYQSLLYASSDERLKDFIGDIEVDLDTIGNIPKKYYTWKNDEGKKVQIGTSAQELNKIYPELVDGDGTGMLAVAYDRLSIVALAAVDKLHEENEKLKEKIVLLEDKIDTLLNK